MAISKEQAVTEQEFHVERPGRCQVWRRNGRTQVWKTRPEDFRIPVKYGLYDYDNITNFSAKFVHVKADCPNNDIRPTQ